MLYVLCMFICLNTLLMVRNFVGWGDGPFRKWNLVGEIMSQGIQGMDLRFYSLLLFTILSLVALGRCNVLCWLASHASLSSVTVVTSSVSDAGLHPSGTVSQNRIFLLALIPFDCCDKTQRPKATNGKGGKDFFIITVSWFQRDELNTAESHGGKWSEQLRDYITDLKHIAARYKRKWEKAINLQSLPWFTCKEGPTRSSTASQTISLTVQKHDSRGTFLIHTTALPQAAFFKSSGILSRNRQETNILHLLFQFPPKSNPQPQFPFLKLCLCCGSYLDTQFANLIISWPTLKFVVCFEGR